MISAERLLPKRIQVVVLLVVLTFAGCGKEYQVGEVEGVLLIQGRPGHKVQIQFIPDIDRGGKGPSSVAKTDAEGRFTLRLMEGQGHSRTGAVVGWHRVVLSDAQLAESATGVGVPIRFGPEYALATSTPLFREVKGGKQTIKIEIR